jgi:hypothetical protein
MGVEGCPACGRAQPGLSAITTQPDDPEKEEVRLRPPPGLAQTAGEVNNRLADGLFRYCFLGGAGLALLGGIWLLASGKMDGFPLLVVSPLVGLVAATFALAVTRFLSGLYETLAGPESWQEVGNEVTRLSPEQGPPAKEERIQPSSPPSLVTAHPKEQTVSGPADEDAPQPQAARRGLPSPFVPVVLSGVAAGFGLVYAFWGGLWEALGGALCLGLPFGFVLGALAVRWTRR